VAALLAQPLFHVLRADITRQDHLDRAIRGAQAQRTRSLDILGDTLDIARWHPDDDGLPKGGQTRAPGDK
jgi:hypothetical protein